jgi:hypothetical protein
MQSFVYISSAAETRAARRRRRTRRRAAGRVGLGLGRAVSSGEWRIRPRGTLGLVQRALVVHAPSSRGSNRSTSDRYIVL